MSSDEEIKDNTCVDRDQHSEKNPCNFSRKSGLPSTTKILKFVKDDDSPYE
jgi:hypothetical protein